MLIGQYEHSIDQKGRLNFPARLRESLGQAFIITKGLDECLAVYSFADWKHLEDKINRQPLSKARHLQRFFFASAVEVEPDKQGRIVIPGHLREYAHLDKDVIITGASERAEIWDKARWEEATADLTSEMMAEAIDQLMDF